MFKLNKFRHYCRVVYCFYWQLPNVIRAICTSRCMVDTKKNGFDWTNYGGIALVSHAGTVLLKKVGSCPSENFEGGGTPPEEHPVSASRKRQTTRYV